MHRLLLSCLLLMLVVPAWAQLRQVPPPRDVAYAPGTIELAVHASNVAQRIMRVRQSIPVVPGPLTLLYPQWLPGNHAPRGPIDKIAGIAFSANGQALAWQRDPMDVYAFHLDIPQGVSRLEVRFDYLSPTDPAQGRVVMTPQMLNLQWNAVLLYPAGHTQWQVQFAPRVTYPAGWQAASALDVERRDGATVVYAPVNLEILVDSPVFAGQHFKQVDLGLPGKRPVRLNVVADHPRSLVMNEGHIAAHRALVDQALKLFGSEHYDHYDFLLALTTRLGGIGLEHQRSSENTQAPDYFSGWNLSTGSDSLLAHEMTHVWNGKYRRPAGQAAPNLNTPLDDSLLWMYEGQTQYWGEVLNARAGLRPLALAIDEWANVAALYADGRPGLAWRSVQDTTYDPIVAARRPKPYVSQQLSEDYYRAGQLIWLEADALIRSGSNGRKSLDDFARAFFGVDDGQWQRPNHYRFEDIVAALDAVHRHDWASFLRDRVEGRRPLTGGFEAAGWRLVYRDTPNAMTRAGAGGSNHVYSLGFALNREGLVGNVRWDSPGFNAGITPGMHVVAVNDIQYTPQVLDEALADAKAGSGPIRLLVKEFDRYRTLQVDYRGGARFPHLERIPGTRDHLSAILEPRAR